MTPLPPELAEAVASLGKFDDARLWELAWRRLPDRVAAELQDLHFKQQRTGLTDSERKEPTSFAFNTIARCWFVPTLPRC